MGWQVMPYRTAADGIDLPIFYARPRRTKGDFLCVSLPIHILKLTQPADGPWIAPFMLRGEPFREFSWLPAILAVTPLMWLILPRTRGYDVIINSRIYWSEDLGAQYACGRGSQFRWRNTREGPRSVSGSCGP
jgi:hypothetical protein